MDAGSGADWSRAPKVGRDIEEDFGTRDEEPYEGESEDCARKSFRRGGLDWDTLTPEQFTHVISSLRMDLHTSDTLGPACFVFCEHRIPKAFRRHWIMAVWAARDAHEGD